MTTRDGEWPFLSSALHWSSPVDSPSSPLGCGTRSSEPGPFRWMGRRSYSLYLWHWPVLVVYSESAGRSSEWSLRIPSLILTALLTVLTYRFVEDPLRHLRRASRPTVLMGLGLTATTVTVLAVVVALTT